MEGHHDLPPAGDGGERARHLLFEPGDELAPGVGTERLHRWDRGGVDLDLAGEEAGRVGEAGVHGGFLDGDVIEAGGFERPPEGGGVAEGEDLPYPGDTEAGADRPVERHVEGMAADRLEDTEGEPAPRTQHPRHLGERCGAVGEEHERELAGDEVELAVGEGQALGGALAPFDGASLAGGGGARYLEHGRRRVEADDAPAAVRGRRGGGRRCRCRSRRRGSRRRAPVGRARRARRPRGRRAAGP